MAFRSHLTRPLDLRLLSNRLLVALVALTSAIALFRWMTVGELEVLWAPAHAFLGWALLRELDPDHDWSALAAGVGAGAWVLIGYPVVSVPAVTALLLCARLVVNTTGRRPLTIDLLVVDVLASAASYTAAGWVTGFGLAVALYVDDRMAETSNPRQVALAGAGALGATVVATAAGAFPSQVPDIRPLAVAIVGLIGLVAVLRAPPMPMSLVDSRMKTPIPEERVHAAWSLTGVLLFAAAALAGVDAEGVYPLAGALALAIISGEVERTRRRG